MDHSNQPIGVRPDAGHKTPAAAAQGQKTVAMEFPKPVTLTLGYGDSVFYPAGVHPVPVDLADHWFLKAHGARPFFDATVKH